MDIGLVYSDSDPRQRKTRDFVRDFLKKRGVTATIVETKKNVSSPTVIINGETLRDLRETPREVDAPMFPTIKEIAAALEQHLWSL